MEKIATAWGGETNINGIYEATPNADEVLILTGSQAAIAANRKAGRTGKARTADLRRLVGEIKRRQEDKGLKAVTLGMVKLHIGVYGNEQAEKQAKAGAEDDPKRPVITERG